MKHAVFAIASLVGLTPALGLVAGCTREGTSSRQTAPEDSGKVVTTDVKPDAPQAKELRENIELQLMADLTPHFADAFSGSVDVRSAERLGKATALAVGKGIAAKARGDAPTACRFDIFDLTVWSKCVVQEVLAENLSEGGALRATLQAVLVVENAKILGDLASFKELLGKQNASVLDSVAATLTKVTNVERLLSRIVTSLQGVKDALDILARNATLSDAPFVAESFFEGRKFVFTTSFAQGSVGSQRMYNLSSHVVRMEVNSGRIVFVRDGSELFDSENGVDLVSGAYPILKSVRVGNETYHQVDFSTPQNKQFLVQHLASPGAQLSLSADVVVPRVAHAEKKKLAALGSGLHFDADDSSLVVDQLILVSGGEAVLPPGAETDPLVLDKDAVRPTVRVVQGLFAIDPAADAFGKEQARDVTALQGALFASGVDDVSKTGKPEEDSWNVPWFTSGVFLPDALGRAREPVELVRKFNREKEIVWVVSKSTPASAVPVVKSAVVSFERLFKDLTPAGETPVKVTVLTQEEFESANRKKGLRLGNGPLHAADPRVNMIMWDESQKLGSAWATAAANPRTGEVISADVMLSGHMWAKEGCIGFFQKTWAMKDEPDSTRRKKGPVPSAGTRFVWDMRCEAELFKLGFYRPEFGASGEGNTDLSNPFPFPIGDNDAVVLATRAGDEGALATLAQGLLKGAALPTSRTSAQAALRELLSKAGSRGAAEGTFEGTRAAVSARSKQVSLASRVSNGTLNGDVARGATFVSLRSGKNLLSTVVDCLREVNASTGVGVADIGTPGLEGENVRSPSEGALALLRATLLHELGHAFGLRHNFSGSLQTAEFEEDTKPATPVQLRTDSMMDYNDYGIDFAFGQMGDYTSERGAWDVPAFGAYDVLAMGAAYGLDVSSLKMKGKPTFCTDGNVGLLGNCQRYDFGSDYNEFLIHDVNMNLARLANIQSSDLILMDISELVLPRLSRLLDGLQKISAAWAISQYQANGTSVTAEKAGNLAVSELAFRGVGSKQDFVQGFEKRMGRKLIGLVDFADIPRAAFDEPLFADLFADFIRGEVAMNVMAFNQALREKDLNDGSDEGLFTAIHDVKLGGDVFAYRTELMNLASGRVLVPAGQPLDFTFFDGGEQDLAATVDGQPLVVTLEKPFFNYRGQIAILKNVLVDDLANPGQKVSKIVRIQGRENLNQMVLDVSLLASLAPGWSESPSAVRLASDAKALSELIAGSESCTPGTRACYSVSTGTAARAASYLSDVYGDAWRAAGGATRRIR